MTGATDSDVMNTLRFVECAPNQIYCGFPKEEPGIVCYYQTSRFLKLLIQLEYIEVL